MFRLRRVPKHFGMCGKPCRFLLCLMLAAMCGALPARAAEQDVVRQAVEAGRYRPLTEILAEVARRYDGRVLDVELEKGRDGRAYYEIKLIDGTGRKLELHADAVSGAVVQAEAPAVDEALPPAGEVLRKVLARWPGMVLDVEMERDTHGRLVYEVKLRMPDERMRELTVDARSGEVLGDDAQHGAALHRLMDMPSVLDLLQARYPGHVLEAELEHDRNGRYFYEVEIRLHSGRVVELEVDAEDGRVLRVEEAD